MATLREQVLARIYAALLAAAPGGAMAMRSREISVTRALAPAIAVMPQGTTLQRMATGVDKNQLDVALEIFVRGDPWDSLADPIDQAAHTVMLTDAPLWALASDVRRISESFEGQEADRTAGTLTVRYQVTYLTRAADISRAP